MNVQQINPYAPVSAGKDDRTRLTFDGSIEPLDYAELLPRWDVESVLIRILLALLALTMAVVVSALIVGLWIRGLAREVIPLVIPLVGFGLVIGAGMGSAVRFIRPTQRARRKLKRFPDLLGPACGQVTESGLTFDCGDREHWFGPQSLLASQVSAAGIRVRIDQDPDRFLALTSRMFDGFDETVALRIHRSWHEALAVSTPDDEPVGLDLWYEMNTVGDEAVAFRGAVTLQQTLRTPENLRKAVLETFVAIAVVLIGCLGGGLLSEWGRYGTLALGTISVISSLWIWMRYFRGMQVETWTQSGWLSQRELAIQRQSVGIRVPLSEIHTVDDHGDILVLAGKSGSVYYLSREHFENDEDWASIKQRVEDWNAEAS